MRKPLDKHEEKSVVHMKGAGALGKVVAERSAENGKDPERSLTLDLVSQPFWSMSLRRMASR